MTEALAVLGGYLLGSLPFGYWLPRIFRGEDIRAQGSGNVGASNVFRIYGRRLGIAVAVLDVGKGFAAASLGLWVGGALVGVLAGAAAMVGHARPVFLRFREGRQDGRDGRAARRSRSHRSLRSVVSPCGSWCSCSRATRRLPRS